MSTSDTSSTVSFASATTTTTTTSSRKKKPRVENESLLISENSGQELKDVEFDKGDGDADEEDPSEEVESIYKYYLLQDSLPWWRRKRNPMVQSLIVTPPWKEIIRAVCFLCIGAALVTFGCLIYYDKVSFMEPRAGITMIVAGSLLFIPGIYVTIIAIRACLSIGDTTYDDIPGASL